MRNPGEKKKEEERERKGGWGLMCVYVCVSLLLFVRSLVPDATQVCPDITLSYGEPVQTLSGDIVVPLFYTATASIFGVQFNFTDTIPTELSGGAIEDNDFTITSGNNISLAISFQGIGLPAASEPSELTLLVFSGDDKDQVCVCVCVCVCV